MSMTTYNFDTGPTTLPDIGKMSYNGCVFGPLFASTIRGDILKDRANRTVKAVKYTLEVDGYVTLKDGSSSVNDSMRTLRDLLDAQGGALVYQGRGFDLVVNSGGPSNDVAWGPIPEVIEFQPLGSGLSAKVRWAVTTTVTEPAVSISGLVRGVKFSLQLLQFNFETSVAYGDDGYSSMAVRGTLEIAMTRATQQNRQVTATADDMRSLVANRIMQGIDLSRFRVVKREFSVSRDKRTMEWDFSVEELPYMDMPPDCTVARGTYSVKPAKAGMGLALWLCTLKATYTVRADKPRRTAWIAFLALLRLRMGESKNSFIPDASEQNPSNTSLISNAIRNAARNVNPVLRVGFDIINAGARLLKNERAGGFANTLGNVHTPTAWLIDFSFDEGLYLESKTVTFSATWRLATAFSHIMLASGIWKKLPERDAAGNSLWALSMADVSGDQSWLQNRLDPNLDVIVDFGGP